MKSVWERRMWRYVCGGRRECKYAYACGDVERLFVATSNVGHS